ncbi:YbjQ family protein [Chloroflexota bacterium]
MLISTTERIEGRTIVETLGLVRGSAIRTRHVGRDIVATLRNLVGGEVPEYTKMMAQSREQAVQRMIEDAEKHGADAIVGVRFTTSMVMSGAAEMLAYGTAVKLE